MSRSASSLRVVAALLLRRDALRVRRPQAGALARAEGTASGRDGWLVYSVRALRFEAPAGWRRRAATST